MSRHDRIYSLARWYDVAFGYRDYGRELDFILDCARIHRDRPIESLLELAAGPARHAIEASSRGLRASALDVSPEMVEYGRALAAEKGGLSLDYRQGNMEEFDFGQQFDVAILMIDSASYLLDNDAVIRHFRSVARHLTEGGIYFMEMGHPRDVFGVGTTTETQWTIAEGGTTVSLSWGASSDVLDPVRQITDTTVSLSVREDGEDHSFVSTSPQRCFSPNELKALIDLSSVFTLEASYGAFDRSVTLDHAKAWRTISLLKKKSD